MSESTPSQTRAALTVLLRAKRAACLWGAPGIGKSQIVQQLSDAMYADDWRDAGFYIEDGRAMLAGQPVRRPWLRDIRAVLLDPVDLRGLPTVQDGRAVWAIPEELPRDGTGVLFLDELNRAPVLVQNACFQLILDRRLGEYELPDGWRVVAACNRESDGGGVTRMSSALGNRFVHIDVIPDLDDFCHWAVGNGVDPLVIAFLRFRPNLLHEFDRESHAFPTPRSWSFVSEIVSAAPGGNGATGGRLDPATELTLIDGAVGHAAATEFLSFLGIYRTLPSIDAIILDPAHSAVPENIATLYAVTAALASRADASNLGRIVTYLDRLPTEYSAFAVRDAIIRDDSLTSTPEFVKWAIAHSDLL